MKTALWWIRRDLRLRDNPALAAALDHAERVIPVFVLDPALLNSHYVGEKRLAFLLGGLRALDADLRERGSHLVLRRGDPAEALKAALHEAQAEAIFAQADVSPYARRRDDRVREHLPLRLTGGLTVHPPGAVRKQDGDPYTVYTWYSRTWKASPLPTAAELSAAPVALLPVPENVSGEAIPEEPTLPASVPFAPGEPEAHRRLEAFTAGPIAHYHERRDRLDLDGTSRLSPYLRFGMLSAREAVVAARKAGENGGGQGAQTWLDELIWREFYAMILFHHPNVRQESFREQYRRIAWRNDAAAFEAWQAGRTGFPIVDAAMRQLQESGWMHNRARMIVASFLTKDLLIDWQWGERHFMQHLIDGDPAANNGGWQWSAGTGTDAAPYFRIFNPVTQGEKHDPQGAYIRHWVPELRNVPTDFIHRPWTMPGDVQQAAGCIIGEDYPAPIVDHKTARERTLAAYKTARGDISEQR
ncbi:MAG: cryptochrome/photolyase family protein [Anaerolineae bacterium]